MDDRVVISRFFDGWVWDRYGPDGTQIAISYGAIYGTQTDAVNAAMRCNAQPYVLELKEPESAVSVLDPSPGPLAPHDPDAPAGESRAYP